MKLYTTDTPAAPLTILIVDDEMAHVEILRREFEDAEIPVRILSAASLRQFHEVSAETTPDIVLLDMNLPDGNAISVLAAPAEDGPYPILLMTSHGNQQLAAQAIKAGAIDYVVKSQASFSEMPQTVSRTMREWTLLRERKMAREAIRMGKEEWERTFDAVPALIAILDREYTITRVNQAMAARLGLTFQETIGRKCFELVHAAAAPIASCPYRQLLQGAKPEVAEFEIPSLNGYFEVTIVPMGSAQGDLQGFVHIMRDITERKIAEEQQRLLEEQLRHAQRMESIGTLAAGIAHDFNNILTAISSYAHICLMTLPEDAPQLTQVQHIIESIKRATYLTQDLLLFSRKNAPNRKLIDLHALVTNNKEFLQQLIGEHIRIVIELSPEKLWVDADSQQLNQVLMNLATNARDAMPDGGKITIGTELVQLDAETAATFGLPSCGDYVQLCVSDTGCGIDPQHLEKIFDPFFTTKEIGQGTGLGLPIVYGILKNHGGTIKVESRSGDGTTMYLYLPCSHEQPLAQDLVLSAAS